MNALDSILQFKIGDWVQPVGFHRSKKSMSIFETRFRVVTRGVIERGSGIEGFYDVRAVSQSGEQVSRDLIQFVDGELMAAEPWSTCGEEAET